MNNIDYTIFDKVSGLPIMPYTDKLIRLMAEEGNESLSEIFNKIKSMLIDINVIYFVPSNKDEIIVMQENDKLKTSGTYFTEYSTAKIFKSKK